MPSPFLPTRSFQAYQIFAANTNVGKTIFATGLCRAAAIVASEKKRDVVYLKPVQTGYPVDSDERHVRTYNKESLISKTLYTYPDPVSPHIATNNPPRDELVMARVKEQMLDYVRQQKKNGSYFFLETAGGIHSPVMSGTPQVDFYRPLRLPTLLVGDGNLGGISTTLTSYESLFMRGYDIPSILLFDHPTYKNHVLVKQRVQHNGVQVTAVPPPPEFIKDPVLEQASMEKYYAQLDEYLVPVVKELDIKHQERFDRLETMAQKSRDVFWWPFTQHGLVDDVTVIDSAHQDYFTTYRKENDITESKPQEMFDSCASWWTQGLGHANPDLTLSAAHAAGRYGHVIFPESTNEPALSLAEKVLEKDDWASRVYFSDNGSSAMEIALKMAMSATAKRYDFSIKAPVEVLGIDGSYHGDTIGTMDACSPNVYNEQVQWYEPKGHWLKPPSVHISEGRAYVRVPPEIAHYHPDKTNKIYYDSISNIYSVDKSADRDSLLTKVYGDYIRNELKSLKEQKRRVGALLMEPILMGAGGMIFVDPLFQRTLIDIVRNEGSELLYGVQDKSKMENQTWKGVPVVFDEVFTGWYRLGRRSASEFLGVNPDITAYAKILTGGLLPLALTVTKESIYDVFVSKNKPDCLLHGHSYTAHPMGCAVAKTSIEKLDEIAEKSNGGWSPFKKNWKDNGIWSMWSPEMVNKFSHLKNVESVMSMGSVLAVELKDDQNSGYSSSVSKSIIKTLRSGTFKNGINGQPETSINLFARPLGNVIYLMTSQITTPERVRQCEEALWETLTK